MDARRSDSFKSADPVAGAPVSPPATAAVTPPVSTPVPAPVTIAILSAPLTSSSRFSFANGCSAGEARVAIGAQGGP